MQRTRERDARIAILGAGKLGSALGRRLGAGGHHVTLAFSRDRSKLEAVALSIGAHAAEPQEAVAAAEIVVLATPWAVTEAALKSSGDLSGKVLWDCTNPLKLDLSGLMLGTDTSGGEQAAIWAGSGARVVKAIPPFAEQIAREGPLVPEDARSPSVFVCGDDRQACNTVATLVRGIGAEPIMAGPLSNARFAEPAGMLLVQLAYRQGMGPAIGLALLRG